MVARERCLFERVVPHGAECTREPSHRWLVDDRAHGAEEIGGVGPALFEDPARQELAHGVLAPRTVRECPSGCYTSHA